MKTADADIERQLEVVGLDEPSPHQEFHTTLSVDSIRNFALGIGDDNPLFVDRDHARTTRWGDVVAPNIMAAIINAPLRGDRIPRQVRKPARGLGMRPVHWPVGEISLVQSVTDPAGARYEVLERWALDSGVIGPPGSPADPPGAADWPQR